MTWRPPREALRKLRFNGTLKAMRISRGIFLVGLTAAAVVTVTPLLLDFGLALPWVAGPLLAAWAAFVWLRGWRWIADTDPGQPRTLGYQAACAAVVLFWSFIGMALAIFLGMLAARYWVWVALALAVLALFFGWAFVSEWLDARARARNIAAPTPAPSADDIVH